MFLLIKIASFNNLMSFHRCSQTSCFLSKNACHFYYLFVFLRIGSQIYFEQSCARRIYISCRCNIVIEKLIVLVCPSHTCPVSMIYLQVCDNHDFDLSFSLKFELNNPAKLKKTVYVFDVLTANLERISQKWLYHTIFSMQFYK